MSTIQEKTDQTSKLFFENEEITKKTFEICHSLSLENEEGIDVNLEKGNFKIVRKDIEYSGKTTERYFLQKDNNDEYAEITSDGVYLDEGFATEKTITHEHKVENAQKVLNLLKDIPQMI